MPGPDDFDLEDLNPQELKALLEELKSQLIKLHNDLVWIRKHLSALQSHLARLGIIHEISTED